MHLQAAIDQVWCDIRYAWRLITRERGFAAVVIVTLTLAVAANTAIYSVIDAVMFRQLPFEQSERLVSVSRVIPSNPPLAGSVSVVHFDEWRRSSTSFEGLSLIGGANFSLTGTGEPESIPAPASRRACFRSSVFRCSSAEPSCRRKRIAGNGSSSSATTCGARGSRHGPGSSARPSR